jgi:peptidoglycan/LPS O-acetylase OafA/YrhL
VRAPEKNREHSIGDQVAALNVGFMERLPRNLIALALILLLAVVMLQVKLYGDVSYWIFYMNPASRLLEFLFGMLVFRVYLFIRNRGGVSCLVASWMEIASIATVVLAMGCAIFTDVGKNFRFSLYYLIPNDVYGICIFLWSRRFFKISGE